MNNFQRDFIGMSNIFIDDSIEELKNTNDEYRNKHKKQREIENQLTKLKSRLSESDKKIIEKYENNIFYLRAIEQGWLYLQGYRYCVKFFKLFRVI